MADDDFKINPEEEEAFCRLMYGIGTKELALYLKQGDIYSDPNWFYSLLSDWDKFHAHGLSIILHEITEKIDEVP